VHLEDTENKIRITAEAFVICNNEILLFKRDINSKFFPGYLSIPGGRVNINEDIMSACIREVKEETGLVLTEKDPKIKYIAIHNHLDRQETWYITGFLVKIENKHEIVNSVEGNAQWIKLEDADKLDLFPPVAYYLKHATVENSGILYSVSEWENTKLVRVVMEKN